MRQRIAATGATVLLLACGALSTASPASAAGSPTTWDHVFYTADPPHGGTLYVTVHGDVLTLCDTYADGLAPRADISVEGVSSSGYRLTASGGYGTCTEADASMGGSKDLPEGYVIDVRLYLGPDGDYLSTPSFVNNG